MPLRHTSTHLPADPSQRLRNSLAPPKIAKDRTARRTLGSTVPIPESLASYRLHHPLFWDCA